MQSITITRPVVIKVRVTENYKKVVAAELQKAVQRLDLELQHLDFQMKKLAVELGKKNSQGLAAAKQQIEAQTHERLQKKQTLLEKIKEVSMLTPGTEITHGRVESLTELKVGDDWNKIMNIEVLVEDGIVQEIRRGLSENDRNGGCK